MPFKFIHAADIHLDSPLRGLARYEGAPADRIRGATREALVGLVQTAIEEGVTFVVIAGDVFDGEWRDYNTGLFFARQMSRLGEEGIRVFMVSGNHDAASAVSRSLKMPDNVRLFSSRAPETDRLSKIGVAVHGQGFARPDVTENLSLAYPAAAEGYYNIGILHTCADGREGHARYAPCRVKDLTAKGYDYWALGHVHQREILSEAPWVVFPGNLQGRHIRETGPKGCTLVSVDDDGTHVEHRDLDVVRWVRLRLDCTGTDTVEGVLRSVNGALEDAMASAENRLLAARLEISGTCRAHDSLAREREKWTNQIRVAATDISRGDLWIEKVSLQTQPEENLSALAAGRGPVADLLAAIERVAVDPEQLANLADALAELRDKLPAEVTSGEDPLDLTSPEGLAGLVSEIPAILLQRLSRDKNRP